MLLSGTLVHHLASAPMVTQDPMIDFKRYRARCFALDGLIQQDVPSGSSLRSPTAAGCTAASGLIRSVRQTPFRLVLTSVLLGFKLNSQGRCAEIRRLELTILRRHSA